MSAVSWLSTCSSLNCIWSNCAYSKLKSLSVLLYSVVVYEALYTGRLACTTALHVNTFDALSYFVTVMLKLHCMRSFL